MRAATVMDAYSQIPSLKSIMLVILNMLFAKSTTSDVQKQNHVAYTGRARQELNNESNQMPDLKMLHPSVSAIGQPS